MWKHNNFFIGFLTALVSTVITIIILILLVPYVYNTLNLGIPNPKILLLAIFPSVILMRYYFRKLNFGKSGNGALIVSFGVIVIYFLFVAGKIVNFPTF